MVKFRVDQNKTKDKPKFSLAQIDPYLLDLVKKTEKKTLAIWAITCVKRILHYFEDSHQKDKRPRNAIETLQKWIKTGNFKMADVRKASLDAHAAAREVGEENAARSAARAAGQAMATAHVKTHSIAAANYALQAIYRSTNSADINVKIAKERVWQYKRLIRLNAKY
ncbi:MAG: putative immunity protein [Candidatus Micrarchaeota archaeon]